MSDNISDELKQFMAESRQATSESRQYRAKDEITQKYQVENIEALKTRVGIQNGRVYKLEEWKAEIEQKIKQRKDNYANMQAWITILATVVMAASAFVMIWKK